MCIVRSQRISAKAALSVLHSRVFGVGHNEVLLGNSKMKLRDNISTLVLVLKTLVHFEEHKIF
jgi:hypothetical protein